MRRGFRAGVLRSRALLDQVTGRGDLFRRPPALGPAVRWHCAVRALWTVLPERGRRDDDAGA